MAQIAVVSVYGFNGNAIGTSNQGQPWGFPTNGFIARPAESPVIINGVTCNTVIQMLPTGLNQTQTQYNTAATVAAIAALANAPLA